MAITDSGVIKPKFEYVSWFAENLATFSNAWLYPDQRHGWTIVSPMKLGAWYLLMIISFVLVSLVQRPTEVQSTR